MFERFTKFSLVGALTTFSGYFIYLFFLFFFSPMTSYVLSFITGIALSLALNAKYTFATKPTALKALAYAIFYAASMGLGAGILTIAIDFMGVAPRLAPLLVLLVTVPVNFLCTQYILARDFS